jgi:hypothetical protein
MKRLVADDRTDTRHRQQYGFLFSGSVIAMCHCHTVVSVATGIRDWAVSSIPHGNQME